MSHNEFKISPQIHDQLWSLVDGSTEVTLKELSFGLSSRSRDVYNKLRRLLESRGDYLAVLGLQALFSNEKASRLNKSDVKPERVKPALTTASQGKKLVQTKPATKPAKVKGLILPALTVIPRRLTRVCESIGAASASRGTNSSLHDDCAICKHFKTRAPANGLYKSQQYKAICLAHNTTLSAKTRVDRFMSAFKSWFPQPMDSEAAPTSTAKSVVAGQQTKRLLPVSVSEARASVSNHAGKPDYVVVKQRKQEAKALRKDEKSKQIDTLDVQLQVLDCQIRRQRDVIVEASRVDFTTGEVTITGAQNATLQALLAKKRELTKRKKQSLTELLQSKKVKK